MFQARLELATSPVLSKYCERGALPGYATRTSLDNCVRALKLPFFEPYVVQVISFLMVFEWSSIDSELGSGFLYEQISMFGRMGVIQ